MTQLLLDGLRRAGHEARWIASAEPLPPGETGPLVRVPAWNPLEPRAHVPIPLWGPVALAALAREVRRAEVVHVHECLNVPTWHAVAIARALRRPVLLTQHVGFVPYGGVLDAVETLAYRTVGRTVLAGVHARVAVSPHVAAYFAPARFHVVPNARDEARFRPSEAPPERTVLFAARLVPKKGVGVVCAVWPEVAARHPDWRLVVAGDGPLAPALAALPNVRMLGQVPPEAMPEVIARAGVSWLPSSGEGFPLTVQEALLCDVPVVVSRDPSFVANLAAGDGAFLCDDDEYADALDAAMALPRDGSRAARARARWASATMVEAYVARYRSLLAGS